METKLTIATITADSVSKRSAQSTWKRPASIQVAIGTTPGGQVAVDQLEARQRAADRGDDHAEDGGALRGAVADHAAEQAGDHARRPAGRRRR